VGITGGTIDVVNGTVPVRTTNNGTVSVTSLPAISGTVVVSSAPAVSGTVVVSTIPAISGTVAVSGTVPVSVPGTVTTASTLGGTTELKPYTAPASGAVVCGTVAVQMASVACKLARFKARYSNSGTVYLGVNGVTQAGTVTDTTSGIPLTAGDDTGWIPIDNTNRFYIISGGTPNVVTYLVLN
jgi:hypothetical protein